MSDKYAVIIKSSYQSAGYDPGDSSYTSYYNEFKEFESKDALEAYLLRATSGYFKDTIVKIMSFKELKASFNVSVDLT